MDECDFRNDDDFRRTITTAPRFQGDVDDQLIIMAKRSTDFPDFCDRIDALNKAIEKALKSLEPALFDWRNDIAHVQIDCGFGDDWKGDDHDDDGWHGGMCRE